METTGPSPVLERRRPHDKRPSGTACRSRTPDYRWQCPYFGGRDADGWSNAGGQIASPQRPRYVAYAPSGSTWTERHGDHLDATDWVSSPSRCCRRRDRTALAATYASTPTRTSQYPGLVQLQPGNEHAEHHVQLHYHPRQGTQTATVAALYPHQGTR